MGLYRELSEPPNFDFQGEILSWVVLKDNVTKVLITRNELLDYKMIRLDMYFRGKKIHSKRLYKSSLSRYSIDDFITYFWMSRKLGF